MDPISRIEDFAHWGLQSLSEQGIEMFDLLGHSMGGMIVQEMIRQAPQRVDRLILYGTGAKGVLPGRFETIETSMERARTDGAEATARRIATTWFLERDAAKGFTECAEIASQASLPAILSGLAAMRDWSGEDHLAAIDAKTLVLWGDQDRTYAWPQVEQLWKGLRNSSLAVIPHSAHAVHAEHASIFNDMIEGFLNDA